MIIQNFQIGGIDLLFLKEGGYTICEANTFPGFKGLEKASGVNVPERIFKSMERSLVEFRKDRKPGEVVPVTIKKAPQPILTKLYEQTKRWFDRTTKKAA